MNLGLNKDEVELLMVALMGLKVEWSLRDQASWELRQRILAMHARLDNLAHQEPADGETGQVAELPSQP